MGVIKKDEIAGYVFWGSTYMGRKDEAEVVCPACVRSEELAHLAPEMIISRRYAGKNGEVYFCDRCNRSL